MVRFASLLTGGVVMQQAGAAVVGRAVEELVEVVAGELPFERFGDLFVVAGEREQRAPEYVRSAKLLG